MDFFWKHAPKIAFSAVAASCATGLVAQDLYLKANAPPDLTLEIRRIFDDLKRRPSPNYPYGEPATAALNYEAAGGRLEVATITFDPIAQHAAHPVPARPVVTGKALLDPEIIEERAVLGNVNVVSVNAEPGRNVLRFEMPALKFMKLVRVEIFRDDAQTTVPNVRPYATVVYSDDPDSPAGDSISVGTEPAPAQTFFDTVVEARKSYTYRLRAVARMIVQPEKQSAFTDAHGNAAIRIVRAPEAVQRASEKSPVFMSDMSDAKNILSASNCDVRFSGLIGDISPEGVPPERRRTDYKAAFSVRVWLRQEWKDVSLQVAPGERLKGTVLLRNPETNRLDAIDFDTGLELTEVKRDQIRRSIKVEEPRLNSAGDPKLDKSGRVIMESREKDSEPIPNETAVLRDLPSDKVIEIPKAIGAARSNARSR